MQSALTRQICLLLSHLIIVGHTERRFADFLTVNQVEAAIQNEFPELMYARRMEDGKKWKMEEEAEEEATMEEDGIWRRNVGGEDDGGGEWHKLSDEEEDEEEQAEHSESDRSNHSDDWHRPSLKNAEKEKSGPKQAAASVEENNGARDGASQQQQVPVPLNFGLLERTDEFFWLSALPSTNSAASRREFLCTYFSASARWHATAHVCPFRPFDVLATFTRKFLPREEPTTATTSRTTASASARFAVRPVS